MVSGSPFECHSWDIEGGTKLGRVPLNRDIEVYPKAAVTLVLYPTRVFGHVYARVYGYYKIVHVTHVLFCIYTSMTGPIFIPLHMYYCWTNMWWCLRLRVNIIWDFWISKIIASGILKYLLKTNVFLI